VSGCAQALRPALPVIDVQNGVVVGAGERDAVVANIGSLVAAGRGADRQIASDDGPLGRKRPSGPVPDPAE
jgi:nicotinamidase-related amidase